MNKKIIALMSSAVILSPMVVFAATLTLSTLIQDIIKYLNQILFLLIGLAVVVFVYYIFKYFIMPNADRTDGAKYVMYSLIGFFVILSLWGLVNILSNTFGLGNSTNAPNSWTDVTHLFPGSQSNNANPAINTSGTGQDFGPFDD